MVPSTVIPDAFVHAVDGLRAPTPRSEIMLEELPAPQRLAPYAHAIGATVLRQSEDVATGRLVLLHDPDGHEAWNGKFRLVTYVTAELEPELAADPLLAEVGWSWLVDALDSQGAGYTALGGTITQTMSTRFGELAGGPPSADLEIRASWTPLAGPTGLDLSTHMNSWYVLLASTVGLPPPGVTALGERAERTRSGSA